MKNRSILDTQDLSLALGKKQVLDRLSFEIWPGYVHAIVGPNGAGKSTLASTIMGLSGYGHYQGDIRFEETSLKPLTVDQRARLGITLAWQEPARYEGLTVDRFLRAGSGEEPAEDPAETLKLVGLDPDEYLKRAVDSTLSGGERKRIELASILTMSPKLVLMDEPDSGIDVEALQKIFTAIEHLKKRGVTVLMITHSPTVLSKADHAFLMCCGRLLKKGPTEEIMSYFGEKCVPCDHKNKPEGWE